MKIKIIVLCVCLLMLFVVEAAAQPKEVTESVTTTYYVPVKIIPLGPDSAFLTYDGTGLTVAEKGEGLFHNATIRAVGSLTNEKGKWNDENAAGYWSLINGDKVFFKMKGTGQSPQPGVMGIAKGTVTIIGGTGKCAGIQGTFEMTRYSVPKPAIEGIVQSYVKANIKYTLPQ
jgi:hypothetical protein